MKPKVRFLLPATSAEDLDLFLGMPAHSLLASGNFPDLRSLTDPTLCVLAPAEVLRRAETTQRWGELGRHVELVTTPIDDLVLDHSFEVASTLAYAHGIDACGAASTDTTFVFLQANLVLAAGSLANLARHLKGGATVLTATYLRVDRARLSEALNAEDANAIEFSPRPLLEIAFRCLAPAEVASIMNSQMSLSAPTGRFLWRHDDSALLSRDFAPALLALRPLRIGSETRGFRDVAFAEAMCPGVHPRYLDNSDVFLGIELIDNASRGQLFFGHRPAQVIARELSSWTTATQRRAALHQQMVFHTGDIPPDFNRTSAAAEAQIKSLVRLMEPPQPALDHPRWIVGFYLWAVRRFELANGALPPTPFPSLLARSKHQKRGWRGRVVRFATLAPAARKLRKLLLGQLPLVTILHPDWLDYRSIKPALRSATGARRQHTLYVADGMALVGRALGTPAFNSTELLDGTYDRQCVAAGSLDTVIIEASLQALHSWARLVQKVMPAVRRGGHIVVFYHDLAAEAGRTFKDALSWGTVELTRLALKRVSVSTVGGTAYRSWLRRAYPLALEYVRRRDPLNVFKGLALFSLATALSFILNVARGKTIGYDPAVGSWTSVTIIIDL
jgi:hypothetical protein